MEAANWYFILPGAVDGVVFSKPLKGLIARFDATEPARDFELLDCNDQSLRSAGKVLIEADGELQVLQARGVVRQACTGKGKFVHELPVGPVRDALAGFPKLRALMRIGAGRLECRAFAMLDDLQKTQLRGELMTLSSDRGKVSLVTIQPLRGYDRAFQAVCKILEKTGTTEGEALINGLFPDLAVYKSKPEIPIGKQEPSVEVATDIIRTYLGVARQNEAGVIADIDTEFLHDYRVSLRRVRSVVSLFKGVFSPEQTAALKREFSDLMAPTGSVRDLDVYLLEKEAYFRLIPPSLHDGAVALFAQFEKERAQAFGRLARRFRTQAYDRQMEKLISLFSDPANLDKGPNAARPAYDYARALIWKRYRKTCKLARSITPDTPDDDVHELRIDCKKLRYLMEFFGPLFDTQAFKRIIKPLKRLQDNLGLFNDFSVQQETLLAFVAHHSNTRGNVDAQLALSVGGLIAVLDKCQKAERERVIANFQHFDSPEIRHLFRSLFHLKED